MNDCACQYCDPGCDEQVDPGQSLCYDCDGGDHLPDRDRPDDDSE